jgi:hypothetical protein
MKTTDSTRHFIGQGRDGMESDSEFLLPKSESELAMDADCTRVIRGEESARMVHVLKGVWIS